MKRLLLPILLVFATSAFGLEGSWTAKLARDGDHLQFHLTADEATIGLPMTIASLITLTPSQINAASMTMVKFELHRDAGTIAFEGTFRNGRGAGEFTFTPDRGYLDKLKSLGIDSPRDDDEYLFGLALHDVSIRYIEEISAALHDHAPR